jgi:hypothetical protein
LGDSLALSPGRTQNVIGVGEAAVEQSLLAIASKQSKIDTANCFVDELLLLPGICQKLWLGLDLLRCSVWRFFFAELIHRGMVFCLVNLVGEDRYSATHMANESIPALIGLQIILIVACFIAVAVSPMLMAVWIRDRDLQQQRDCDRQAIQHS